MSETELMAENKRLNQHVTQQGYQIMQISQRFEGVGTACYSLITELLMAIGDPEDVEAMKRAKNHAKGFLKSWEAVMEQKMKQAEASSSAPTANGTSSSSSENLPG